MPCTRRGRVSRRRAAPPARLRRDARARGEDPRTRQGPPDRSFGAAGATLRGHGQERQSGRVADEVGRRSEGHGEAGWETINPHAGAYRVIPATRSKSASLLARLVNPFACIIATIRASFVSRPVDWLIAAPASS